MLTTSPGKVENALESMLERNLEAVAITNRTSAEAVIFFEGSSTDAPNCIRNIFSLN